jgi:hypothetical protein
MAECPRPGCGGLMLRGGDQDGRHTSCLTCGAVEEEHVTLSQAEAEAECSPTKNGWPKRRASHGNMIL